MANVTNPPMLYDDNFTLDEEETTSHEPLPTTITITPGTTLKPCESWDHPICDPYILAIYYISVYGRPTCYALGIPGNALTFIILARMRPFNSSSIWLLALASVDLFSLMMRLVVEIVLAGGPYFPSDWSCKFFNIMGEFCEHLSYMYLVGLTVERFIAVWFPLKMAVWCTKTRAVISIMVIQAIILSLNLHLIETCWVRQGDRMCVIRLEYRDFVRMYQNYVQNTLCFSLPVASLIVLNVLIVVRLHTARNFQKERQDQQMKAKEKQQRHINRILTASTVWFLFSILMEIVYRYTGDFWGPDLPREFVSDRARIVVGNLSSLLRMYNHAANFVLYIIAARKFRSEAIRLVTCGVYIGFAVRATNTNKQHTKDTKVSTTDGVQSEDTKVSTTDGVQSEDTEVSAADGIHITYAEVSIVEGINPTDGHSSLTQP